MAIGVEWNIYISLSKYIYIYIYVYIYLFVYAFIGVRRGADAGLELGEVVAEHTMFALHIIYINDNDTNPRYFASYLVFRRFLAALYYVYSIVYNTCCVACWPFGEKHLGGSKKGFGFDS